MSLSPKEEELATELANLMNTAVQKSREVHKILAKIQRAGYIPSVSITAEIRLQERTEDEETLDESGLSNAEMMRMFFADPEQEP